MKTTLLRRPGLPPITVISHESCSAKIYTAHREKNGQTYDEHTLVYSEAGKRVRKAFADLATARLEAETALCRIATGQTKALTLTNADAEAYTLAKQELAHVGNVPLLEAVREYRAAVALLKGRATLNEAVRFFATNGATEVKTKAVPAIVDDLLAAKKSDGLSAVYLTDLRLRLERFETDFGRNITEVTTREIEEWLRGLNTGGRNRNNFAAAITSLFRFAKRCGYLPADRVTAADSLQRAKVKENEVQIFTPAEVQRILDRLRSYRPDLLPFAAIGAFAGLRTAEIARLDWSAVKFDEGHIVVAAEKAKTAQRRLVPIQPNLAKWLADYRDAKGKICPFIRTAFQVQREVSAPMQTGEHTEAGIPWKHNGLRHSYGSYRLASLKNAAEVALEMGNSPSMIFRHYRELVTPKEAIAYWAIEPRGASGAVKLAS